MKNEAFAPTPELLAKMDAWWRAANYLSACQLYLLDDPLLRRRLTERDIKKKIVGHWGTVPGQNFVYVHLNRVIKKYDQDLILISGPGHGGNFFVAKEVASAVSTAITVTNVSVRAVSERKVQVDSVGTCAVLIEPAAAGGTGDGEDEDDDGDEDVTITIRQE